MPEKDSFPRNPKRYARYPWPQWADGEVRKFVRGEDFDVPPSQFVVACRRFCEREGRKWAVESVVRGGDVFLKITKPKKSVSRKVAVKK